MQTEQQVVSFEKASEKPGAWLKVNILDEKGTARVAYIKDEALHAVVTQPGVYSFTKEKNGKFWDIVGVKFVRPVGATAPATASNGSAAPAKAVTVDANVRLQNRAITAQVCVKAAAEVFGKAVETGAFKDDKGFDAINLTEYTANFAELLMKKAGEFVTE